MTSLVARLQTIGVARDKGATAVEYALMAGLIALVIAASVSALGVKLTDFFAGVPALIPVAP